MLNIAVLQVQLSRRYFEESKESSKSNLPSSMRVCPFKARLMGWLLLLLSEKKILQPCVCDSDMVNVYTNQLNNCRHIVTARHIGSGVNDHPKL